MSEFQGIETHSGLTDFGQRIEHWAEEIVHPHETELKDQIRKGLPTDLPAVDVRIRRPNRANVVTVTTPDATTVTELLGDDPNRYRALIKAAITNAAGSAVWLGSYSAEGPVWMGFPLEPGATLPIEHGGKVYVKGSAAGLFVAAYVERF